MNEEEKEHKIKVPLFKDGELDQFNKMLDNDLDNFVSKVTKQVLKDKELILMQKVIAKQQKEIELKDKVIEKMSYYIAGREIIHTNKEILIIQGLWSKVTPEKPIWDLIKEYFYREVENEQTDTL